GIPALDAGSRASAADDRADAADESRGGSRVAQNGVAAEVSPFVGGCDRSRQSAGPAGSGHDDPGGEGGVGHHGSSGRQDPRRGRAPGLAESRSRSGARSRTGAQQGAESHSILLRLSRPPGSINPSIFGDPWT